MEKKDCINCKTHFKENQRLPLQGISIELKNYTVPIKDQKHKWILLKTICSLLNSKGGTIFIGAEDSTGEVKGMPINRKEQDQFRLFTQNLVQRISPAVDLSDKQEVIVQFLPVLTKQVFMGKYLIKIAVCQGNTSRLYCFSQKLTMQSPDKKCDEYEIVYAYKRQNMGNIKELKGMQLVNEVTNKAMNPAKTYQTFHEDCNPQPATISQQIMKIGFSNISSKQTRKMLEQWFEHYLKQLEIEEPLIDYDEENNILGVQFETKGEFDKVVGFIDKNLIHLNQNINNCQFVKGQIFLDYQIFKNIKEATKPKQVPKKINKQKIKAEHKNFQVPGPKIEEEQATEAEPKNKKKADKKENLPKAHEKKKEENFNKTHCLTFTHINPGRRKQFVNFLEHNIMKCSKHFIQYENTVELFFEEEDEMAVYLVECYESHYETLKGFGFKDKIIFGENLAILSINNYNKKQWKELEGYIKNTMGKDLKEIESTKKGNNYSLTLYMANKKQACIWLDKLLQDKKIKNFKIPGETGKVAKMKIFLEVEQLDYEY